MGRNRNRGDATAELRTQLERMVQLRRRRRDDPGRVQRPLATEWRAARMWRTYDDLLRQPRYRPAIEFFLDELYSGEDMTERDADFRRIARILAKILPHDAVFTMAAVFEMNALTEEIDSEIQRHLPADARSREDIDAETYAGACRRAGNRAGQERQCELFERIGRELDQIVSSTWVSGALRLAGRPARLAGLGNFHEFLLRGHDAVKNLGGADSFLEFVIGRERAIIERVHAGHPAPFDLGVP